MIPGHSMHHGGSVPAGGQHLPNQLSVVTTVNYGTHAPNGMNGMDPNCGPPHSMVVSSFQLTGFRMN